MITTILPQTQILIHPNLRPSMKILHNFHGGKVICIVTSLMLMMRYGTSLKIVYYPVVENELKLFDTIQLKWNKIVI